MPDIIYEDRWLTVFKLFSVRLKRVFSAMDEAYRAAAGTYGFCCNGCVDNCCRSLFYHHTFLEYFYLKEGFDALAAADQDTVRQRAGITAEKLRSVVEAHRMPRLMCPLNVDGRCALYTYRPMICRLHGIPHELRLPGGKVFTGPGCELFEREFSRKGASRLDRTPFYTELAELERTFKQTAVICRKPKMTVARMIETYK